MQHYMYTLSESPDITLQSKQRRVDLGMPRGFLAGLPGKGDTDTMLNGTDDMMENGAAADLLRKMLHKPNGSIMSEKNGHDTSEKAKTGDFDADMKMMTNDFQSEAGDDKSSEEMEALESGTDEGSIADMSKTSIKENCNGSLSPTPSSTKDDLKKAKRARVENIITFINKSPTPSYHPYQMTGNAEAKRPKRKQYQPKQQMSNKSADSSANNKKHGRHRTEKLKLKKLLGNLQEQLNVLQEKYCELYEEDNSSLSDDESDLDDLREPIDTVSAIHKCEQQARIQAKKRAAAENAALLAKGTPRHLRDSLKKELARTVYSAVDNVVEEFASKHIDTQYSSTNPAPVIADTVPLLQFPNKPQQSPGSSSKSPRQTPTPQRSTPHRFEEEQTEALPLIVPKCNRVITKSLPSERSRTSSPAAPTYSQQIAAAAAAAADARAEAVAASEMLRSQFLPPFLPTSVAIPNPSLHPFSAMSLVSSASTNTQKKEQKDLYEEMRYTHSPLLSYPHPAHHPAFLHAAPPPPSANHSNGSEMALLETDGVPAYSAIKMEEGVTMGRGGSPDLSSPYSRAASTNSGLLDQLTPTHLRKAKLMFFYTRYPSSALLRQHFPDVQFNRHNTSQIIKWFSNFREFYYIQIEKFARQAYGDGVEDSDELIVTKDSELFRVLSLHYNKSNDFSIPDSFLNVSTHTLREFFDAVKLKKDVDSSWKKVIYKVIGKLDDMVPEIFKSPTCLEELEVLNSR